MKTLGIVGGLGPESTIEYYRLLISRYRERVADGSYPSMVINSLDVGKVLSLAAQNRRTELTGYLLHGLIALHRAGADFAIVAANTPHMVFDELSAQSPIPLISIVQAACNHAKHRGLKKLGLFGTRSTMQAGFYQKVFAQAGIKVEIPDPAEQDLIHEKYVGELVKGIVSPATREQLVKIALDMKQRHGIEGLILGGTELPLLLRDGNEVGVPLLDTTRIHVDAALEELCS